MDIEEYKSLLKIDKNALDDELLKQSERFYDVSNSLSLAVSLRDKAYEDLKLLEAELDIDVRRQFESEGRKSTEGLIRAEILSDTSRQSAVQHHLDTKTKVDQFTVLKESFQQRSYMLRELVQLYIAGYYMDNSVTGSKSAKENVDYETNRRRLSEARRNKVNVVEKS